MLAEFVQSVQPLGQSDELLRMVQTFGSCTLPVALPVAYTGDVVHLRGPHVSARGQESYGEQAPARDDRGLRSPLSFVAEPFGHLAAGLPALDPEQALSAAVRR